MTLFNDTLLKGTLDSHTTEESARGAHADTTLLSAVGNNTQSGLLLALHSPRGKKRGKARRKKEIADSCDR